MTKRFSPIIDQRTILYTTNLKPLQHTLSRTFNRLRLEFTPIATSSFVTDSPHHCITMDSPSAPRTKRHSKSCKRCSRRKQRCHGFPVCTNCQTAKQTCIQSDFAIDLHQNSPEYAAFERIKSLEEQLALALAQIPSTTAKDIVSDETETGGSINSTFASPKVNRSSSLHSFPGISSPTTDNAQRTHSYESGENNANSRRIADTVGFLSLSDSIGGEPAYVGSSSGISLATSLGQLVQSSKLILSQLHPYFRRKEHKCLRDLEESRANRFLNSCVEKSTRFHFHSLRSTPVSEHG